MEDDSIPDSWAFETCSVDNWSVGGIRISLRSPFEGWKNMGVQIWFQLSFQSLRFVRLFSANDHEIWKGRVMLKNLPCFTKGVCGAWTASGVPANLCQWQLAKPVLRQQKMFVFTCLVGGSAKFYVFKPKNANASLHANELAMKCQEWQSTYETMAPKNGSTWWDARPTERLVARRTEVIKGICACKSLGKNWDRCVGWGVLGTTQAVSYQKNVGWRFRGAGHCCCCCCRRC